ncbi:FadR/GntR family transcriptional regulator [Telmatospirillum sp.]|uniref:FadR/GntR family transcriptional regulator n=1 Tax=Telmatospirillum sp. TaxID=2079197 RepID=UPI002841D2DB|nr:FadR/GntR family transcriptional regulator [Telmatospirillum sp.]MDR3436831.1 FadR/GntR family transcriptional regulator [Telmatospirillum sp.]
MAVPDIHERVPALGTKIVKQTVKEQVSDKLAYMICSGLLRVGDELPSERELAVTLGVSRETARGAIQTLAARGMVEVSQGARTRVIRADGFALHEAVATLRELKNYTPKTVFDARQVVESAVVRDATQHMSAETLDRLENLLSVQSTLFDDAPAFQISDREFHETIYQSCENPLLARFVSDLYAYALDVRRMAMTQSGAVKRSYEDHLKVFAALKAHDPEAVVAAMASHLISVYNTSLAVMNK